MYKCKKDFKKLDFIIKEGEIFIPHFELDNTVRVISRDNICYFFNINDFYNYFTLITTQTFNPNDSMEDLNKRYEKDNIKPSYYNNTTITPFDYIKANNLDFFEGNIIKYITRHKSKNGLEDLLKAEEYLKQLIKNYN